jgi:hypothetical protein
LPPLHQPRAPQRQQPMHTYPLCPSLFHALRFSHCPCSIALEDVKDPAKRTVARKEIAKVEASLHCSAVPLRKPKNSFVFWMLQPFASAARCFLPSHLVSRQVFTEKHKEGKNAWFFSKLRF